MAEIDTCYVVGMVSTEHMATFNCNSFVSNRTDVT